MVGARVPEVAWHQTVDQRADGQTVRDCRERLRGWLNATVGLDAERVSDIVLATDEALTNVVDHAYPRFDTTGAVRLLMSHEPADATIDIRVTDQGCWREPAPAAADAVRGRGLTLMTALADLCTVQGGAQGTVVSMHFKGCPTLEGRTTYGDRPPTADGA